MLVYQAPMQCPVDSVHIHLAHCTVQCPVIVQYETANCHRCRVPILLFYSYSM